jgi:prolyl 4-hydroxylase
VRQFLIGAFLTIVSPAGGRRGRVPARRRAGRNAIMASQGAVSVVAMNLLVSLSPELGAWIAHNLDRGCAAPDVVQAMRAQAMDPGVAQALVDVVLQARRDGLPPPRGDVELTLPEPGYRHETPRLAAGPLIRTFDRAVVVALRVERPALALLESVLSPEDCAGFIELAHGRMRPSTVVDPATGRDVVAAHRSSEGLFLRPAETPFVARIERRLAELMNCPLRNGEGLQLLHYRRGAGSAPHFDFLTPGNATNDASLARSGQRVSSLVIYLNDVERGGATVFPEIGLAVTPRQGHAVHFEYANRHGDLDLLSVHAAAPVEAGEKWVLTKWMREREFVPA